MSTEARLMNAERTIEKCVEVLRKTEEFFRHQAEMNAAGHMAERVMYSPLHSATASALRGIAMYGTSYGLPLGDDDADQTSNLVIHAERELAALGNGEEYDEVILQMIRLFSSQGHSGGSAFYTIGLINRLLQFQNLSDLTSDPEEWMHVGETDAQPFWQSRRRSDAFTYDPTFKQYYTLEDHPGTGPSEFAVLAAGGHEDLEVPALFETKKKEKVA